MHEVFNLQIQRVVLIVEGIIPLGLPPLIQGCVILGISTMTGYKSPVQGHMFEMLKML